MDVKTSIAIVLKNGAQVAIRCADDKTIVEKSYNNSFESSNWRIASVEDGGEIIYINPLEIALVSFRDFIKPSGLVAPTKRQ